MHADNSESTAVEPLAKRLWNASPASLARAFQRRAKRYGAKAGWYTIKSGPAAGAQLFLPNANEGAWPEMVAGTFDQFLYAALAGKKDLKGATCWDIGAHIGYHTLGFATLGAQVVAFEPNQHNAARLRLHLEKNPVLARSIRYVGAAVSDRDGEMTFVQTSDVAGGSSSGSHLAEALPPLESRVYSSFERLTVPTVRIDSLIETHKEKVPDVIKIDVEGAELLVLQGGKRFFTRHKPILLMEVHHICLMFYVQEILLALGYTTRILDEKAASASRCFIMATQTLS